MSSTEEKLIALLATFGKEIVSDRKPIKVVSTSCIDEWVPNAPGVYWIETTMPAEEMLSEISNVIGKEKRLRKKPPKGTSLIEQVGNSPYIAYSGTEEDMRKRLKQHLFNAGHADTVKLGCLIDEEPFSSFEWSVWFKEISSYELRYAVEAWSRLNCGWPKFCLR